MREHNSPRGSLNLMLHALTSSRYRKRDLRHSALFIPPLLPMLVAEPPEGDEWEHEIKHDGYRTLIITKDGDGHAFTRHGHDWTRTYQPVVAASARLGARSAAIDGEMIVQDAEGRSDFSSLRNAIERAPHRLVFMAFDLLEIDGDDLRSRPLGSRRARLRDLVADSEVIAATIPI